MVIEVKREVLTAACKECGKKLSSKAEICPNCGVRVRGLAPSKIALLSLLPGLGQLYEGRADVAFAWWILIGGSILAYVYNMQEGAELLYGTSPQLGFGFVILFLWLVNIYDAYWRAKRKSVR